MKATAIALGLVAAFSASAAHACSGLDAAERPSFIRPVDGEVLVGFGMRHHPILGFSRLHTGVDYAASVGEPVRASAAGEVVVAAKQEGYGLYVRLRHAAGFETAYAQLSEIAVKKGDCVAAGAVIARTGTTEVGPHLHFEVLANSRFLDPVRMRGAPR